RKSHVGFDRYTATPDRAEVQQRGRVKTLPLLRLPKNRSKFRSSFLGFCSLVFLLHRGSTRRLIRRCLLVTTRGSLFTRRSRRFSRRWRCSRRRRRWCWFFLFTASCKR